MNNRVWIVYGIGLLLLALLFIAAIPVYSKRIPKVLEGSVQSVLLQKGFDWVGVQFSGRDATLSGKTPNADTHADVIATVQAVPGVREVIDHMTPRVVSPYTASIEWKNGKLALTGFVPDQASYQAVSEQQVRLQSDASVADSLQFANGSPSNWTPSLLALLENIQQLDRAKADLVDLQLHLSGITGSSKVREAVIGDLNKLTAQGYLLDVHITATDAPVRICQQTFDELLQTPVLFESGAASIEKNSLPLLDQLAETALLCPNVRITVAGHTDNLGNAERNLKLSEQRAKAVIGHLFNAGVETGRIMAMGYGATRPLADNETDAGRAKNRRIEFIVEGN